MAAGELLCASVSSVNVLFASRRSTFFSRAFESPTLFAESSTLLLYLLRLRQALQQLPILCFLQQLCLLRLRQRQQQLEPVRILVVEVVPAAADTTNAVAWHLTTTNLGMQLHDELRRHACEHTRTRADTRLTILRGRQVEE